MAFSLEAAAAVPLILTLILQPVQMGPKVGSESVRQAKHTLIVTHQQINPPTFYRLMKPESADLSAVQASPQLMLELTSLAGDTWRSFSTLVSP